MVRRRRECSDRSNPKEDGADFAQTTVKEEIVEEKNEPMMEKTNINLRSSKRKRGKLESQGEVKQEREETSPAMLEACRMLLNMSPSCIKSMVKSNINGPLYLPRSFGHLHLPKSETMITLEDENSREFEVKYFPTRMGFSNGWKKLADAKNLREGDVILFHLTDPTKFKFKIYITRLDGCQGNVDSSPLQQNEQGGSEPSEDATDHQSINLGTFGEFQLKIQSLLSEFKSEESILKKYYILCHSKKDIMHKNSLHLNNSLVAGMISKTVNITDAVKASTIFTPKKELERWEKALESFMLLGMEVEFLVDRVRQLLNIRDGYDATPFADEIKILEAEHIKLKEACEKVGANIIKLKSKAEIHEVGFQQVVDSPW